MDGRRDRRVRLGRPSRPFVIAVALTVIAGLGASVVWYSHRAKPGEATVARVPDGCHTGVDPAVEGGPEAVNPLAPGQPLAGTGIEAMTAEAAHALLVELRICHNFRWIYMFDESSGYSEIWCEPPPGTPDSFGYQADGTLVVFTQGVPPPTPRTQPDGGWGCPS